MVTERLYNRKLQVSIYEVKGDIKQGLTYDETFKINFSIKRVSDGKTPDSAEVSIYNVDFNNYMQFQVSAEKKLWILIEGGYEDKTGTLYKGDITNTSWEKQGADTIFKIQAGDGQNAQQTKIVKSYPKDTISTNIVDDLLYSVKSAGADFMAGLKDTITGAFKGSKEQGGKTLNGSVKSIMDDMLNKNGLKSRFINNELYVVDKITGRINDFGVYLSPSTGLLGSPLKKREQDKNDKNKMTEIVQFKALLQPDLVPGREVELDAKAIQGKYIIQNCSISGDTWASGEWSIDCEAR